MHVMLPRSPYVHFGVPLARPNQWSLMFPFETALQGYMPLYSSLQTSVQVIWFVRAPAQPPLSVVVDVVEVEEVEVVPGEEGPNLNTIKERVSFTSMILTM